MAAKQATERIQPVKETIRPVELVSIRLVKKAWVPHPLPSFGKGWEQQVRARKKAAHNHPRRLL